MKRMFYAVVVPLLILAASCGTDESGQKGLQPTPGNGQLAGTPAVRVNNWVCFGDQITPGDSAPAAPAVSVAAGVTGVCDSRHSASFIVEELTPGTCINGISHGTIVGGSGPESSAFGYLLVPGQPDSHSWGCQRP